MHAKADAIKDNRIDTGNVAASTMGRRLIKLAETFRGLRMKGMVNPSIVRMIVKILVIIKTCRIRVRYAILIPFVPTLFLKYSREERLLKRTPAVTKGNTPRVSVTATVFTVFNMWGINMKESIWKLNEMKIPMKVDITPPTMTNIRSR
jgi:hypothetical protein